MSLWLKFIYFFTLADCVVFSRKGAKILRNARKDLFSCMLYCKRAKASMLRKALFFNLLRPQLTLYPKKSKKTRFVIPKESKQFYRQFLERFLRNDKRQYILVLQTDLNYVIILCPQ